MFSSSRQGEVHVRRSIFKLGFEDGWVFVEIWNRAEVVGDQTHHSKDNPSNGIRRPFNAFPAFT